MPQQKALVKANGGKGGLPGELSPMYVLNAAKRADYTVDCCQPQPGSRDMCIQGPAWHTSKLEQVLA